MAGARVEKRQISCQLSCVRDTTDGCMFDRMRVMTRQTARVHWVVSCEHVACSSRKLSPNCERHVVEPENSETVTTKCCGYTEVLFWVAINYIADLNN